MGSNHGAAKKCFSQGEERILWRGFGDEREIACELSGDPPSSGQTLVIPLLAATAPLLRTSGSDRLNPRTTDRPGYRFLRRRSNRFYRETPETRGGRAAAPEYRSTRVRNPRRDCDSGTD